jgi:hypothetical protein
VSRVTRIHFLHQSKIRKEKMLKLEKFNQWFTLIANFGVLVGIVFLGLEIRQNTAYLSRGESNATFEQASTSRILSLDREFAELLVRSKQGESALDEVDQLRLSIYYNQWMWTANQIYVRELDGYIDAGEWERSGKAIVLEYISGLAGRSWWQDARTTFPPEFSVLVDEILAANQ